MDNNTNDNNQKPVTLDDLAAMMKRQFDDMGERFDTLEGKVDSKPSQHHVDSRFDALEESMTEKMTEPSIRRDRKLDEKTNVVAQKLGMKTVFTREEVTTIERLTPFAATPIAE